MVARSAVGLIAGSGRLPEVLAESLKAQGRTLVVFNFPGAAGGAARHADHHYEIALAEMAPVVARLQEHDVGELVFAGGVPRVMLVGVGDATFRTMYTADDDQPDQSRFLRGTAQLEAMGVTVLSPLDVRPDLAMPPGVLTSRAPIDEQWRDIGRGLRIARLLAADGVGQVVAVRRRVVVAIEAADGTDATIARAGGLARQVVIVKAARPEQDPRFDLPTAGVDTIQAMGRVGASVLAMDAGRTLLLDRADAVAQANEAGIAIVGVESSMSDVRGPMSGA
ncbi:MAG: LpxI family protein [bacterium]